ncbi:hypothetical protein PR048_023047 [Dryococelus australis]|uniref:Uncharacterized protein n=1 Tax=Dryococelus australis TaxID=614101 RepID=A0ABQ9GT32_9NEOP|nr:hypothetical protein PR048_023047 [Dryococelus australis]
MMPARPDRAATDGTGSCNIIEEVAGRGHIRYESPSKPADQRHRPARFPHAKIREWRGWGLNPVRLGRRRASVHTRVNVDPYRSTSLTQARHGRGGDTATMNHKQAHRYEPANKHQEERMRRQHDENLFAEESGDKPPAWPHGDWRQRSFFRMHGFWAWGGWRGHEGGISSLSCPWDRAKASFTPYNIHNRPQDIRTATELIENTMQLRPCESCISEQRHKSCKRHRVQKPGQKNMVGETSSLEIRRGGGDGRPSRIHLVSPLSNLSTDPVGEGRDVYLAFDRSATRTEDEVFFGRDPVHTVRHQPTLQLFVSASEGKQDDMADPSVQSCRPTDGLDIALCVRLARCERRRHARSCAAISLLCGDTLCDRGASWLLRQLALTSRRYNGRMAGCNQRAAAIKAATRTINMLRALAPCTRTCTCRAGPGGLARSPPTKAIRARSPAGPLRIFASGNRAGRCRWSGWLSRGSPVSPAPSFQRRAIFTSITLIGSQDLARLDPDIQYLIIQMQNNCFSPRSPAAHVRKMPLLASKHGARPFANQRLVNSLVRRQLRPIGTKSGRLWTEPKAVTYLELCLHLRDSVIRTAQPTPLRAMLKTDVQCFLP